MTRGLNTDLESRGIILAFICKISLLQIISVAKQGRLNLYRLQTSDRFIQNELRHEKTCFLHDSIGAADIGTDQLPGNRSVPW